MVELSAKQASEFKQCFSLFDQDQDGIIAHADLGIVLRSLGIYVSEGELDDIKMKKTDPITWQVFVDIAKDLLPKQAAQREALVAAFRVFDKENTGSVSVKDLKHVLTSVGDKMTDTEFDEIMKGALVDRDGQIQYESFVKLVVAQN